MIPTIGPPSSSLIVAFVEVNSSPQLNFFLLNFNDSLCRLHLIKKILIYKLIDF